MKLLTELNSSDAKLHLLTGKSYFNGDFPEYISFEPMLKSVSGILGGNSYAGFKCKTPNALPDVNYQFITNKDGRFAWRPIELIHPAIYVSLVNLMCEDENWQQITSRFASFEGGAVICCSLPVISSGQQSHQAEQVRNWWHGVEQESLKQSLVFSHLLQTDVTDCYGSLYTHSISWALHGLQESKANPNDNSLLGNQIDQHVRASRYGQTNGISQGSVVMDLIAELVLGYVDDLISGQLGKPEDFAILRYRDDYRIFSNSDARTEEILKVISDCLREVGMRLGVTKTISSTNVVEGSVKPDKLAGVDLQDLGTENAKTLQKQLLRLHSFGRRYPNSGALRRLVGELHSKVILQREAPDDLEVQAAIATDIAVVSPQTFPAIAGVLSHLLSLASKDSKISLWNKIVAKLERVPYNGYMQIWMQRIAKPSAVGLEFLSQEPICMIVNGEKAKLWNNDWIASACLKTALDVSAIMIKNASKSAEIVAPKEVQLFIENAWAY